MYQLNDFNPNHPIYVAIHKTMADIAAQHSQDTEAHKVAAFEVAAHAAIAIGEQLSAQEDRNGCLGLFVALLSATFIDCGSFVVVDNDLDVGVPLDDSTPAH
jgi:hypothetical protein